MLFFGFWVHVLFCLVRCLFVINTSAVDCTERFVTEMAIRVEWDIKPID